MHYAGLFMHKCLMYFSNKNKCVMYSCNKNKYLMYWVKERVSYVMMLSGFLIK